MEGKLPIYEIESALAAELKENRRLIVQAPTGSGKSTQVPQMLIEHGLLGRGQAVILQPRRLAARLLAARVAQERNGPLGREVGYQIRFENVTGPETRIRFITEGVLLRQMVQDAGLAGVQALIFDEFHERHLYGDITLARALDVQESTRPDLLILVMSATLDLAALERYLAPCAALTSAGRVFPVELEYLARQSNEPVWDLAAGAFSRFVRQGGEGDVLIFMPGSFEIQQTLEAIRQTPESRGFIVLPLHGELSPRDQDAAVARYGQRKVVVSTNVAETSLTIDGVRLVIDSGLARIPRYDPRRGINTLLIEKISRASADQRAGRAGRTAPGHCYRLWPQREPRPPQESPEIKRLDLAEVILALKAGGVGDLQKFRWLEPPEEKSLENAERLLEDLGALDHAGKITGIGRKMLAFPLHPRYARMLLAAEEFGCVHQACLVAALTQGRDLLIRNPGKPAETFREDLFGGQAASDFWIWMRAWNYAAKHHFDLEACRRAGIHAVTARQVGPLHAQFLRIAEKEGLHTELRRVSDEALQRCILTGFADRVARRLDEGTLRCEVVHGRRGLLARESVVRSPFLVAAEIREVEGAGGVLNTLLSLASAIEADWLRAIFPEDIRSERRVFFDATAKRVMAEEREYFHDLVLSQRRIEPPPADATARALAEEVVQGRLVLKNWDHGIEQWILRLNLLSRWCPEFELPGIGQPERQLLIEQICQNALSYRDIKDRNVAPIVKSWLSAAQNELLEVQAPGRLPLANGRAPKVNYSADSPPFIALRIQELYGVESTPRIGLGRVPVLVHILAPNMRPVQITQDLANFWLDQYPKVKQELQRKYPKHEWR